MSRTLAILATMASAVSRISFSLTSQPNLFQLFQPIGGVRASIVRACASTPARICSTCALAASAILRCLASATKKAER